MRRRLLDLVERLHGCHARVSSEHLLDGDDLGNSVDHLLHELDLGEADALLVGDVPLSSHSLRVLARRPAGLQVEGIADLLEGLGVLVELGDADHDRGAEAGAEVGGAGAEEAELFAVHELRSVLLRCLRDGVGNLAEAGEDRPDVSSLLHCDDAAVVLFVAPGKRRLLVVVEDAAVVRPLASSPSHSQQLSGTGLLEEEAVGLEHLLLLCGEVAEGVVLALQLSLEHPKRLLEHVLHALALLRGGAAGEGEAADVPGGANAGGLDVLVELELLLPAEVKVEGVEVRPVGLSLRVELVPALDDGVDDLLEELEALLVSCREADAEVGLQHAALDGVGEGVALGGGDVLVLGKELWGEDFGHERAMARVEGRELGESDELEVLRVLGVRLGVLPLLVQPHLELGDCCLLLGGHALLESALTHRTSPQTQRPIPTLSPSPGTCLGPCSSEPTARHPSADGCGRLHINDSDPAQ
eukprot:757394-Hanusia_phi.AAC.9